MEDAKDKERIDEIGKVLEKEGQQKPSVSNIQLQNQINELREENEYLETTLANVYDWLDNKQNELGQFRQMMKNTINRSPMKMTKVRRVQEENQSKADTK